MTARCHTSMGSAAKVHAPVARGECRVCHAPDTGGHVYPLLRPRAESCSTCHTNASLHGVGHPGMAESDCLSCHDPHTSGARGLLAGASGQDVCATCHARAAAPMMHLSTTGQRCDVCHEAHGSEGAAVLDDGGAAGRCGECHAAISERYERAGHAHRELPGGCMGCHREHGTVASGAPLAIGADLCVSCHKQIGADATSATSSHDVVLSGKRCLECHEPHGSRHAGMLKGKEIDVCLSCHDREVKAKNGRVVASMAALRTAPTVHGAVTAGECSACHSVHGGSHARLLNAVNVTAPMGAYDRRNFALCFSCHDPRLVDSAMVTGFRDGGRNLHELHMRGSERSGSCAACHAVHSAEQAMLMASSSKFEGSAWSMPLMFTATDEGGRCGPGCHEPMEYKRRRSETRPSKTGGVP